MFSRVAAASVADLAGSVATAFIILRISTPAEVGAYFRIVSLGSLAAMFSIAGLNVTIRYYASRSSASNLLGLGIVSLAIFSAGLSLVSPVASLVCAGLGLYTLHLTRALAYRRYDEYLRVVLLRRISQPLVVPIAFAYFGPVAAAAAYAATFLPSASIVLEASIGAPEARISDILYNAGSTIVASASVYLDKVLVGFLYGEEALGAFYFIRQACMIGSIAAIVFDRYAVQEIARGKSVEREFSYVLAFSLLVAAGLTLSPGLVARAFPNYSAYAGFLRTASAFVILRTINAYLKNALLGRGEFRQPFAAQAAALAASITAILLSSGELVRIFLSPAIGQAAYAIVIKIARSTSAPRP